MEAFRVGSGLVEAFGMLAVLYVYWGLAVVLPALAVWGLVR